MNQELLENAKQLERIMRKDSPASADIVAALIAKLDRIKTPMTIEQIKQAVEFTDETWHSDDVTDEWAHRFARAVEAVIKGQS